MSEPRSRWSVVAAYALLGAATQILWLNYAGVTTVAAAHYGVSASAIGWLAQVFPLLYIVLAIPAGLILDRWFRAGLAAGALLTAAGALLRLGGDGYGWLLAGQLLVAVAQPLVLNAVTGITGRYLAPDHRPTGIAIGTASTFGGMVIAFVLGALLPGADQLTTLTAIGAGFSAVAAIAMVSGLRRPGEHHEATAQPGLGALRVAWSDGFVRRLCTFAFAPFGAFIALTTFAQALLAPAGVSAGTASLLLLANVVAGVIGSAVLPVLAARHRSEIRVLTGGLLVAAAAVAALAVAPGTAVAAVSLTLIGFVLLPGLPIAFELAERHAGQAEGTAAGLIWMAGNLGGLVVATVTGLLVDRPTTAFLLISAIALLGLPAAAGLRRTLTARATA